ncbi:uncharacterized protein LOC133823053 isoform X2 [Humulus lupulus]|uniref:uncharacterized protein LOC133823053 isoform X2 n=1 Tax=Humulus lupulus TaxID=3486 RepID=UPI002B40AB7F|nr:uncharacterized protein LOC133823053 isoform X2 [Humulus lupulus]
MVTRNFLVLKSILNRVMYENMLVIIGSIWVFVWGYIFYAFGFTCKVIFRLLVDNQTSKITDIDEFREKEGDFHRAHNDENKEESKDSSHVMVEDAALAASTNKYEVFSGKFMNGFLEEPKPMSFIKQELNVGPNEFSIPETQILESQITSGPDIPGKFSGAEAADFEEVNDVIDTFCDEDVLEKRQEDEVSDLGEIPVSEISSNEEDFFQDPEQGNLQETELSTDTPNFYENSFNFSNGVESFSENFASTSDEDTVPNILCDVSPRKDQDVDSITYEFSRESDREDVNEGLSLETETPPPVIVEEKIPEVLLPIREEMAVPAEQHNDTEDEYIELELHQTQSTTTYTDTKYMTNPDKMKLQEEDEKKDGEGESEFVWEHEDVIEQLKWEIKNARTGGLPTILEEESDSESPKKEESINFKPLKIDLKCGYKDRMEEIQNVYKIYAGKTRKLDILNDQTMHALGFLLLKDQRVIIKSRGSVNPIVKSLLTRKTQRSTVVAAEPIQQHAGALHKDFELVYVGQVCLSWEILHWQQTKVQELLQYDDVHGSRSFNLVASEFQLFQVLLQRFIEDESFRGPRIDNYVKNRCVIRNLLHVPAIRDDCMKDKLYGMEGNGDSILLENMANVLVEAMFTFWDFLRKDTKTNINQRVSQKTETDPADSKLLIGIRKDLYKKDRKVKDVQRSGNCVVKKFQKHQEQKGRLEQVLFHAQVELRLIARVLNMSRLTRDQLIWCQRKLNQISFFQRKVLCGAGKGKGKTS